MQAHLGRLIDHVHLRVSDLEASRRFYRAVLASIGLLDAFAEGEGYFAADELYVDRAVGPVSRVHLAFQAADRETVGAFHRAALDAGGRDNGAPGERSYHPGYYGAFVLDPDGNNVEAVFHGAAQPAAESTQEEWETRVAALWKRAESMSGQALVAAADALADERERDDAAALFERASARDRAGIEAEAERYYRTALATGRLDSYRSSRASIQLASTLRILGQLEESEQLLIAELDRHLEAGNPRALHDEARATLALTYVAQGRAAEAAGLALFTLAPHLSRYNRSVSENAAELVARTWR